MANYPTMPPDGSSSGRSSGGDPGYVTRGGERVSNPGDIYGSMLEILNPQKDTFENATDKWSHLLGGEGTSQEAARNVKKQEDLQREFAQNSIRWRVDDAIRAGINPHFALGAQGASYTPMAVMGSSRPATYDQGHELARSGQNLMRAMSATMTNEQRIAARLNLENMKLQNDLLRTQIANNLQKGPAMPSMDNFIPGQGNSGLVQPKPATPTVSDPGRAAQEAGWRPDVSYSRTDTGLTPMIPEGLSESLEDDIVGKVMWRMRNQIVPNFTGEGKPSKRMLPKGFNDWVWNHMKQEWQPTTKPGKVPYYINPYK